jgi:hypothetical protein
MAEMKINTANYPYLEQLMQKSPDKARELMSTFIQLMDEAAKEGWHELPEMFSRDLTFSDLVKGVLHGSLDLPKINPDAYDALKEEVHPLSMLSPRRDYLNGGLRHYNWRGHFRLPSSAKVNQETIETIFRRLLRYYKYIRVDELGKALSANQVVTYKDTNQAELLPFYPALRYQQRELGDLQVGLFFDDVGAFDLGKINSIPEECPACKEPSEMWHIHNKIICERCNGGWELEEN